MSPFVVDGREVVERGMPATRIVPALDEVEERGARRRRRGKAGAVEELAFHDPERICGLDRAIWRGMLAAFAPDAELRVATTRAGGDDACVAEVRAN